MKGPYDDILGLPRHVSAKHPPMSRRNRAAQFAPFSALAGYGDAIRETARHTEPRRELDPSGSRSWTPNCGGSWPWAAGAPR